MVSMLFIISSNLNIHTNQRYPFHQTSGGRKTFINKKALVHLITDKNKETQKSTAIDLQNNSNNKVPMINNLQFQPQNQSCSGSNISMLRQIVKHPSYTIH